MRRRNCDFRLDLDDPELARIAAEVARRFEGFVTLAPDRLAILPEGVPLARVIASAFDGYLAAGGRFSCAS